MFGMIGMPAVSLTTKLIGILCAVILIVSVVTGVYFYAENSRNLLIKEAQTAALAQVKADLAQKSEDLVKVKAAETAKALKDLNDKNAAIDAQVEAQLNAIDDAKSMPVPVPAPGPDQLPFISEDKNYVPQNSASVAIGVAAGVDRLLERSSAGTKTHR